MEYISGHDTFQIVNSVNSNYRVWNIGENMGRPDLIPLCQMENARDHENFNIRRDTLKAIRLPECEVRILRAAAGYGISSLQEARKALKSKRHGWMQDKKRELAERSLPVFERIYEEY
jgi:hypothetical protein